MARRLTASEKREAQRLATKQEGEALASAPKPKAKPKKKKAKPKKKAAK